MDYKITCGCNDATMTESEWQTHFLTEEHLNWFTECEENIQSVIITCGCEGEYNYSNAHNHFKSSSHKEWQKEKVERRDNVLIICKCGDIIRYKDRKVHDSIHIIPYFES